MACSDGLVPDAGSGLCPDNGARVNLADCSTSDGVGAAELKTLWRDPAPTLPGVLLCAGTGKPHLPLVDLGRDTRRGRAAQRSARHSSGAGMVIADLVPAGAG